MPALAPAASNGTIHGHRVSNLHAPGVVPLTIRAVRDDRLTEMRVFRAVVDTGGFSAAAHSLTISQSTVSHLVGQVERRLGVQLLQRSTRGHRLTDEGERYYAAACRLLEAMDAAEASVTAAGRVAEGDLRLTAPLAFGSDQVVPLLPAFMEAQPRLRLHLSLSDAMANLVEDRVDVAVRMGHLPSSSLAARRLCDLRRIVVATPGYLARRGRPSTPDDLQHHECLLWHGAREHLNRWPFRVDGERREVTARGRFRSSDGLALFRMCSDGVGVMRLAEHLALPAIRAGVLEPLLVPYQHADDGGIHAVFLPERTQLPRVRAFVDFLVERFRAPPWLG